MNQGQFDYIGESFRICGRKVSNLPISKDLDIGWILKFYKEKLDAVKREYAIKNNDTAEIEAVAVISIIEDFFREKELHKKISKKYENKIKEIMKLLE
jgi:hypothetical protein